MTKREAILEALMTVLGTLGSVSSTSVFRSRVTAFLRAEAPAVMLTWQRDQPDQVTLPYLDWSLQFKVSVLTRGAMPDSMADSIVAEVHQKLMADISLGGRLIDLQPGSADFQSIESDADAGVISSTFVAIYRTQLQNLES